MSSNKLIVLYGDLRSLTMYCSGGYGRKAMNRTQASRAVQKYLSENPTGQCYLAEVRELARFSTPPITFTLIDAEEEA